VIFVMARRSDSRIETLGCEYRDGLEAGFPEPCRSESGHQVVENTGAGGDSTNSGRMRPGRRSSREICSAGIGRAKRKPWP
jgi:hypothetical protein